METKLNFCLSRLKGVLFMANIIFKKRLLLAMVMMAGLILLAAGCASGPSPVVPPPGQKPAVQVQPETVRLGVARLMNETDIEITGWHFKPGDSVFINMTLVEPADPPAQVPSMAIANAVVDKKGCFTTEVEKLVKISDLLRADVGLNRDMEKYIIIDKPPIPEGSYRLTAESMASDKTASCQLTVKGPTMGDRFKDWLGGLLGKIENK